MAFEKTFYRDICHQVEKSIVRSQLMMTTPFLCVFLAFFLIYVVKIPVAIAMYRLDGRYDNCPPREQQRRLDGWGLRALAAHQNGFETFPAFAAGVIIAHLKTSDPKWTAILAVTYVVSRALYAIFYIANWSTIRSIVWGIGFLAVIGLFFRKGTKTTEEVPSRFAKKRVARP